MYKKSYILSLDSSDRDLLINGFNEFRNNLIEKGIDTVDVDRLLLRIINTPVKKDLFRDEAYCR